MGAPLGFFMIGLVLVLLLAGTLRNTTRPAGLGRAWAERIGYWHNNALVIALRRFANLLPHHKQQVKKLRHATHFLQVDAGLFQNISYVASLEDVCSVFQTFASRYAARVRERSRFTRTYFCGLRSSPRRFICGVHWKKKGVHMGLLVPAGFGPGLVLPTDFYTRRLWHQGRFAPKPTSSYTNKHRFIIFYLPTVL